MAGGMMGLIGAAGGLLDLGRVALEKVAPADPEERRKWTGGKELGRLAGLVAFLDVRIPDLEARGADRRAGKLRAIRAQAAARIVELRKAIDAIDGWREVAEQFREELRSLKARGARITYTDGSSEDVAVAFRRALASMALRLRDEDDDKKAAASGQEGSDEA